MSEIIKSITEIEEINGWYGKQGFAIETNNQVIKLLIDAHQDCCERWGYFLSEDDTGRFIGAKLQNITITDTSLNTKVLAENELQESPPYVYEGGIMFVNIHTSIGLLQFVAYNEHNGYYGHDAKVTSEQLIYEETL